MIFEQTEEQDRELEAHLSNDLGSIYFAPGNYQRALEYQVKALAIEQDLFGEQHPATTTSVNNVGTTYGESGDYQRALEYLAKALAILRALFGNLHPTTVLCANNVARSLANVGAATRLSNCWRNSCASCPRTISTILSSIVIDNSSSVLAGYAPVFANHRVIPSRRGEERKSS